MRIAFSNQLNRNGVFNELNEDGFDQETLISHTCFERRETHRDKTPAVYVSEGGFLLATSL